MHSCIKAIHSVALTAAILMTLFGLSRAQDIGTIKGRISDHRTGEPLIGANILIIDNGAGTATGPDGTFEITGIPPGKHTIRISYLGYKTHVEEIKVHNIEMVRGQILDTETGEPLSNVRLNIKGSTLSTSTSRDGSYLIPDVPPGTYTLQIHQEGFRTRETGVSVGITRLNFALFEDIISGEEILVTGMASKSARALAEVSVASIDVEPNAAGMTHSSSQELLQSKISGLQMMRASGNVSSGYLFNLRTAGLNGDEQPVVYLDGVRIDNNEFEGLSVGGQGIGLLADLNPEEIASIEVLKGPAATVSYGSNGADGVVSIRTKRGRYHKGAGKPLKLDYKFVTGWNVKARTYQSTDFITAPDANALFRSGSIVQNTLSATGGSRILRYYAAVNNRIEEGILPTDRMNRRNIRANIDLEPFRLLSLQASSSYSKNKWERPINDNNMFGYLFNTTGRPESFTFVGGSQAAIDQIRDESDATRFIGSIQAELNPFRNFSARLVAGIDDHQLEQEQLYPANSGYADSLFRNGVRNTLRRDGRQITVNLNTRLATQPRKDVTLALVTGIHLFDRRVEVSEGPTGPEPPVIQSAPVNKNADANFLHLREAGLYAEGNLSIRNRYSVSLKVRRDYTSEFGEQTGAVYYPGLSVAWRIDQYKWLPDFFTLLKVRSAYGEAGNLPDPLDRVKLIYRNESGGFGNGAVTGIIGNDRIKPERVKEIEFGIDTELFHNVAFEATYYRQNADDSIVDFLNAPSTGLTATAAPANLASARGSGFEALLHGRIWRSKSFDASFRLINAWRENEITSTGGSQPIFDSFGLNVIAEGLAKYEFLAEPVSGALFNDNGTYAGPDVAGSRTLGNPVPDYTGAFALNLNLWKNLNIYLLADWATGHKIWNGSRPVAMLAGNNQRFNVLATQLGLAGTTRFDGIAEMVEPVGGVARLTPGTIDYFNAATEFARVDPRFQSNFIESADFLNIAEVAVSYSLAGTLERLFKGTALLQDMILTATAHNLFTSSSYSGTAFAANWSGTGSLQRGQDFFTLQAPRTFNLALRVLF